MRTRTCVNLKVHFENFQEFLIRPLKYPIKCLLLHIIPLLSRNKVGRSQEIWKFLFTGFSKLIFNYKKPNPVTFFSYLQSNQKEQTNGVTSEHLLLTGRYCTRQSMAPKIIIKLLLYYYCHLPWQRNHMT